MQEAPKKKVYIDERILERVREGDQDAFRELYEVSYRPLYAFLVSYTQNAEDAKDLLQDTYVQIFSNIHQYQSRGNPMAWMMKVAKNLFLMKKRKEQVAVLVNYDEMANEIGFSEITNIENRMVLEKMFELLSVDERNIIVLHDVSGLKHREIAKVLSMPLGTVISKYNRGIKKLQSAFEERSRHEEE